MDTAYHGCGSQCSERWRTWVGSTARLQRCRAARRGSARRRSGVSSSRARAWHSATGTASAWRPRLETAGAKVAFTQADVGTETACLDFVNGAAQKFGPSTSSSTMPVFAKTGHCSFPHKADVLGRRHRSPLADEKAGSALPIPHELTALRGA